MYNTMRLQSLTVLGHRDKLIYRYTGMPKNASKSIPDVNSIFFSKITKIPVLSGPLPIFYLVFHQSSFFKLTTLQNYVVSQSVIHNVPPNIQQLFYLHYKQFSSISLNEIYLISLRTMQNAIKNNYYVKIQYPKTCPKYG